MSRPSPGLALAWRIGASEAGASGHPRIECAHLFMGLLSLDKATPGVLRELRFGAERVAEIAAEEAAIDKLLESVGHLSRNLRRVLRGRIKKGSTPPRGMMSRSSTARAAFARAETLAAPRSPNTLHLLSVLLEDPDPIVAALVRDRGLAPLARKAAAAGQKIAESPGASVPSRPPREKTKAPHEKTGAPREKTRAPGKRSAHSALARFGRDLTALAKKGEIGPVIGRGKEIRGVLQALARSARSSPLLVGEPGVGKTAIVEALALRAVAGQDPEVLGGRRIVELQVGSMLAGTDRGEFEKRMKELLDELKDSPEIILFVDDIHSLVGAGRLGNGRDAASLFKPALARGEIRVIGATTGDEFRTSMERDVALERRFERIDVPEPSLDEAIEILRGLKSRLERRHGRTIEEEALQSAASLSVRFDPDHRLPDKAVDLLERAAARSRTPETGRAVPGGGEAKAEAGGTVNAGLVAAVLAEKRGLPLEIVTDDRGAGARLLKLEAHLRSRIIGQDEAVSMVASRVRLGHSAPSARPGPLAVFLFLGPRGVGKTEMARSLAKFLVGGPDDLVRFGMSEYTDELSVARLVGAPPGYVGHDEPGRLTEAIRRRPHAVLLFDEVEKAHPSVLDVLLQLFDAGRLTDGQGRVADGRRTIVIMASTLDQAEGASAGGPGEDLTVPVKKGARTQARLRQRFRPEFLNRIDDVIPFRSLEEADVRRIARPLLARLAAKVRKSRGVFLRFEAEAEAFVIRSGFDAERGVRDLKEEIERLVEMPLGALALSGKLAQHPAWKAVLEPDGLHFVPE